LQGRIFRMPRGGRSSRISTWNRCCTDLGSRGCRFRIRRRSDSPWIYVREWEQGRQVRQFSSGEYRIDSDHDIEVVYRLCLSSHEAGRWVPETATVRGVALSWPQFSELVLGNIRQRIPRQASRSHAEGHLRTIAAFTGAVTAQRLEQWASESDPIAQSSPFRRRIETLSQIQASGLLDLQEVIIRQRARRPSGSARRRQQQQTQRPRAIPSDAALQAWLDGLRGHEQWVFALICPASTPLAAWRQSSWPVRGTDRPPVVACDNRGAMALEATPKLSHPSVRTIASTGFR
jgi:hypothetical protein